MTLLLTATEDIPRYIPLKMDFNNVHNIYDTINFDYIILPSYIVNNLKYYHDININKFIPKYITTPEIIRKKLENIVINNSNIMYYNYLCNKIANEFINFSNNTPPNNNINCTQNNALVDENGNIIFINSNTILLIINNILYITDTNENNFIMSSSKVNYIEMKDSIVVFKVFSKDSKSIGNAIMKNNRTVQYLTYTINEEADVTTSYYFQNNESNLKMLYYGCERYNGNIEEYSIKNNLHVNHTYNHDTKISKLISQCMMNDINTGMRYRGTYEELKENNTMKKKTLTKDDDIIYNKENNVVLVDKINNMTLKEDIVIGWKVAKSLSGEKRIIKLAIPIDAIKIKPIDKEYFNTRGKERCNKAIVMDIQFAMEEEISLVPTEMEAYSYIFNDPNNIFKYTVGTEVVPDMFDDNINESCTNGIHYYRDRQNVFDVYINR
jgi:hypothetical protein